MSHVTLTVLRIGDGPVARGATVHFLVRADCDLAIGAIVAAVAGPPGEWAEIAVTDRLFAGAEATGLATHASEPWGLTVAGARMAGAAGTQDLFEVQADVTALPGRQTRLHVSLTDLVTVEGVPLPPVSASVAIDLEAVPLVIDDSLEDAHVDVPFHGALSASGNVGRVHWSIAGDTLPPGLLIDEDGRLHGTPVADGEWTCEVTALDEGGGPGRRATATISVRVRPAPLTIIETTLPPLAPGVPYRATLRSRGGRAPIRWSVGELPEGLALHGEVIEGVVAEVPRSYRIEQIRVIAQDAGEPEARAEDLLLLPTLPLVESQRIAMPGAERVALGRDLVLVPYEVRLEVRRRNQAEPAEQDRIRERLRERLISAIVEALLGDAEASVRDAVIDPFDRQARDRAEQRAAMRAQRIRWLQVSLEQIEASRLSLGRDIEVLFDHEPLLGMVGAAPMELRQERLHGIHPMPPRRRSRTGLLWKLLGPYVLGSVRGRIRDAGRNPATEDQSDVKATSSALGVSTRDLERRVDDGNGVPLRSAVVIEERSTRLADRLGLAVALVVTGVLGARAGWMKGLSAIVGTVAAALLGRRLLLRDLEGQFERLDRIVDEWRVVTDVKFEIPYLALGRIECTPGAHRLDVRWTDAAWPVALSDEERIALFGDLSVTVRFRPENPEGWPRLAEPSRFETQTDGNAGTWTASISLAGSDIDLLVADARGEIQLLAGRGDGSFAPPRVFAVCADLGPTLLVGRLDPIGRSSVAATQGRWVRTWLNDGLHGFAEYTVSTALGDGTATALGSGDLDGDGWHEIIVGAGSELCVLDRLEASTRNSGVPPHLLRVPLPLHVGNDALSGVAVSEDVGLPPGMAETPPGNAHALVIARYGGEAILMRNEANGRLGAPLRVPGLEIPDPRRQPVGLVVGRMFGNAVTAVVTTQRPPEALIWLTPAGLAPPRFRLRLPFVPANAAAAPARCGGVLVADRDGGRVFMLAPGLREDLVAVPITFLGGQVHVASNEGVSAAVGVGGVVIYR